MELHLPLRPDLHLAYTHRRKVEKQLNPVFQASNFLAVQLRHRAGTTLSVKSLDYVYFVRNYDLFILLTDKSNKS